MSASLVSICRVLQNDAVQTPFCAGNLVFDTHPFNKADSRCIKDLVLPEWTVLDDMRRVKQRYVLIHGTLYIRGTMSLFVDVVSVAAGLASLAGVSLKDLRQQPLIVSSDAAEIKKFIDFLQSRNVLLAPIDDEIQAAVIKSIEEIKKRTERLSENCFDEGVKTILLKLRLAMSEELRKLHKIDATTSQGKYRMYVSLQTLRLQFARALALFCAAFEIDPKDTRLEQFILQFSIRPRA